MCSRHAPHCAARLKMFAYVGINDPLNGCWLPRNTKIPRVLYYLTQSVMAIFIPTNMQRGSGAHYGWQTVNATYLVRCKAFAGKYKTPRTNPTL
nr:hypothetical protein [Teredinibacter turnerae]